MENKMYIVTTHHGYMDDSQEILVGIYDSQWKAEMGREQYLIDLKKWKNKYTAEEIEKWENHRESGEMTPEAEQYYDWYSDNPEEYSQRVDIEEHEINKQLYKFGYYEITGK